MSFYDELDGYLINSSIDVSTGLYLSNNAIVYNDSQIGRLTLGGGPAGGGVTLKVIRFLGDDINALTYGFNFMDNTIISSGTVSGVTSIIYMNPADSSGPNWGL